jgi:hypothetical protein
MMKIIPPAILAFMLHLRGHGDETTQDIFDKLNLEYKYKYSLMRKLKGKVIR